MFVSGYVCVYVCMCAFSNIATPFNLQLLNITFLIWLSKKDFLKISRVIALILYFLKDVSLNFKSNYTKTKGGSVHWKVNLKNSRNEIIFDRLWYPLSILLLAAIGPKLIGPHGGLQVDKQKVCQVTGSVDSSIKRIFLQKMRGSC